MDLRDCQLLIDVAESGSFSGAARRNHISQPSVSARIAAFENRYGIQIFQRLPAGTRVTDEGQVVVGWARELLDSANRFETVLRSLSAERRDTLRVAASLTVAECLVPFWLTHLRAIVSTINVSLTVANSREVTRAVLASECEIGFVEGPGSPSGLRFITVARDELLVLVQQGDPWSRRRTALTAKELASRPLILREPGSGTRETLEHALQEFQISITPQLEFGSNAAVKAGIAAGHGAGVLSRLAASDMVASGQLVEVPVELNLERRVRMVRRADTKLSQQAAHLLAISRSSTRKTGPIAPGKVLRGENS